MAAVAVVLAVFLGLSGFAVTLVLGALLISGRLTIPGTAEHHLKQMKYKTMIAEEERQAEAIKLNTQSLIETRHQLALGTGKNEGGVVQ